jgi:two-component system, OmpR family, response regulator MprA
MIRVLVVDDDPGVRAAVARALRLEGYRVDLAIDGGDALDQIDLDPPDAVVLDVMMPVLDGHATVRHLRDRGDRTPVLMLTARDSVSDRVSGLNLGADDYLPKPFALEELLARVQALVRRSAAVGDPSQMAFADLTMDLAAWDVRRGERRLQLTRTEFVLLETLLRNARVVIPRDVLFERVWGHEMSVSSNSLDVYVGYLRRKMEEGGEPRLVQTIRGVGYVLREP